MTLDLQQQARETDALPIDDLANFLLRSMPEFMKNNRLHIKQFSGGASNLTYQLSNGENELILRRPPVGTKAKTAHDMVREYNVLNKLSQHFSLSPKPYLLCEDESILGSSFFIMEKISGLGINHKLPIEMSDKQQFILCHNFIEKLVKLHQIDIVNSELVSLGKPEGYALRQLEGWYQRFNKAKTDDVADIDGIYQWLKTNLPLNSGRYALLHNDYKFDNFILDPKQPETIIGIIDWEMATLGDPLLDLGCSLAYWIEADDKPEMHAIRMMPTHLSGMMSRQQIFDLYCLKSNITNQQLTPYYVFGLFRLAVIAQQIYYRFYHGQTDNPKFKNFGQLVGILIQTARNNFL